MAKIDEALKLDDKYKFIHEYKVEFTEANVKEALDKVRWDRYSEALDLLGVAQIGIRLVLNDDGLAVDSGGDAAA